MTGGVAIASSRAPRGALVSRAATWWMLPARAIGRVHPLLGRAVDADTRAAARLPAPVVALILPVAVIVLALVPSIIHALSTRPLSSMEVDLLRLRIDDVYTEAFALMAGALVAGMISPAIGVLFVLAFGVFDLAAASMQPGELVPLRDAVLGRIVSYWLLWLLVVEVPLGARGLASSASTRSVGRIAGVVVGAAAAGAFTWIWSHVAPSLIRITYAFSFLRVPQSSAIQPLDQDGWVLAIIGAAVAAIVVAVRGPRGVLGGAPRPIPAWNHPVVVIVRRVAVAGFLTLSLEGVIDAAWQPVLLFAALLLARPVAMLVASRTPLGAVTTRVPTPILVALALAAGFGVALALVPSPTQHNAPTFDRLIIGIVVVLFVIELVMARPARRARSLPAPAVALLGLLGLLALAYALPVFALADNCAEPSDCYGLGAGAALAAAGIGAAMAFKWSGAGEPEGPPPPEPSPPPLFTGPDPSMWDGKAPIDMIGPPQEMHDEANWRPRGHDGPCVLTTACVEALGKPDDCHELRMFRRLRDDYLAREPGGAAVVADYYRTAPQVIASIRCGAGADAAWVRVYRELVAPVADLVDAGRIAEAAEVALARYDAVKCRYGVS